MSQKVIDFSPCCRSFLMYNDNTAHCSTCDLPVFTLSKPMPVSIVYNSSNRNQISAESLQYFSKIAGRFATDPTCELCMVRCEKCNSLTRYIKNPLGELMFVCSSPECRYINMKK
jgi:hypothetical protein